jgi:hypothetical protein
MPHEHIGFVGDASHASVGEGVSRIISTQVGVLILRRLPS